MEFAFHTLSKESSPEDPSCEIISKKLLYPAKGEGRVMNAVLGILIAVSAIEQDRGVLENLVPHPKIVETGPSLCREFRLEGATGFHPCVLPSATFVTEEARTTIRVRLWGNLSEDEKSSFPEEASHLEQDPEAYALSIRNGEGLVTSTDRRGLQHGLATLRQACILAEDVDTGLPEMTVVDWPDVSVRGAHICYHLIRDWMPYSAPDFKTLVRSIERFAQLKISTVLLELEAMFPFQKHPDISTGCAFSPDEIREVVSLCESLQIDLIPLLQCLGHQYYVLTHERYQDVRETPDMVQQLCPTNPRSAELVLELIDEYREVMPNLRTFHLGGDESRQLGDCARCRAKIDREGVSALYVDHVAKVCSGAVERGITPTIWSDMLEHHPDCMDRIPKETVIAYWNYDFKGWPREYAVQQFKEADYEVVAYPGIRFGKAVSNASVNYPLCMPGIRDLVSAAKQDDINGIITTNWMKGIPYELCWRGYCYAAWEPWTSGHGQEEFDRAFASIWYGLDDKAGDAMTSAFEDLAVFVPYAEDSGKRLLNHLNRFDLSGLPVTKRIEKYAADSEREKTLEQIDRANEKVARAKANLATVQAKLKRNGYEWRLLEVGSRMLDHKIRMGRVFDKVVSWQRGELDFDDDGRSSLRGDIEVLKNEWSLLREETRSLLAESNPATCAASLADVKFERDAFETLERYQRLLMEAEKDAHPELFAAE
jgi:glycosyl hydrolase family 20